MAWVFFGVGLALLLAGSGAVARSGSALLRGLGVSPLVTGLVVVSLAMCAPELAMSLQAAAKNHPEISIGMIAGSNIINILLVFGLAALFRPVPAPPKVVFRDGLFLLAASVAVILAAIGGELTKTAGFALLGGLALYIVVCFVTERGRHTRIALASAHAVPPQEAHAPLSGVHVLVALLGLAFLFFGARYAVDGALALSLQYRLPVTLVALTLVAFGAALPEMGNAVAATVRGENSFLSAQLIGSSIFNILFVIGLTAALHPLTVSFDVARTDLPVMGAAAVLLMPLMLSGWRATRIEGLLLIAGYACYAGFLAWRQGLLVFGP